MRNTTQIMIPLHKEVTTIGRKQADIILDDAKVSGSHAEIRHQKGRFKLVDLKSTNGTFVNRRKTSEAVLADQDVIEIGMTTLCFFSDTRDFHGQVEEVTASTKARFQPPTQTTNVSNLTTTTKTLQQARIQLEFIRGEQKGKKMSLQKSHILIGRSDVDVIVNDMDVSRSHALIEVMTPRLVYLRDLGSTNGTFLNGEKIASAKLSSEDEISVGTTALRFRLEQDGGEE